MPVPSFILKKLYIKKSLKPVDNGFELQLKNVLADATIIKPVEVAVDGNPVPLDNVKLVIGSEEKPSSSISESNPLPFNLKAVVKVVVTNYKLEPGQHKITLKTKTKEYGDIKFDIKEKI